MKDMTLESVTLGTCLSLLNFLGINAWRNNTGAVKTKTGFVRYGKVGSSDIIGILPDGRFLAVECKRPSGEKVTTLQQEFIDMINHNGGVGLIVRSSDELFEKLKRVIKNAGLQS